MTRPEPVDTAALGYALVAMVAFFGILETWHQFRDHSGWVASGWFAAWLVSWGVTIYCNKQIMKRRSA